MKIHLLTIVLACLVLSSCRTQNSNCSKLPFETTISDINKILLHGVDYQEKVSTISNKEDIQRVLSILSNRKYTGRTDYEALPVYISLYKGKRSIEHLALYHFAWSLPPIYNESDEIIAEEEYFSYACNPQVLIDYILQETSEDPTPEEYKKSIKNIHPSTWIRIEINEDGEIIEYPKGK